VIDKESFHAISIASPIAQKLLGNKVGSIITFNNNKLTILEVM
jgi:transcription elongation GreA/GreB family factor